MLSNGNVVRADGTVVGTAAEPFNSVSFTDGTKSISIAVSDTTTATVTENGVTTTFTDNGNGGFGVVTQTVAFNSNGGTAVSSQNVNDGYNFAGWATTSRGAVAYSNGQSVSNLSAANGATVALYAKWLVVPSGFVYAEGNGSIKDLLVCDHEVTQGEYETYCCYVTDPSDEYGVGANYPAYNVSFIDAVVYCNLRSIAEGLTPVYYIEVSSNTNPANWGSSYGIASSNGKYHGLGKQPSQTNQAALLSWTSKLTAFKLKFGVNAFANGYRLPKQVEWEYIAKGGSAQNSYTYSGSNNVGEVAWYSGNSSSKTHTVKGKKKNSLGIYDMSGNVAELCHDNLDFWGRSYRGGSWNKNAEDCTVSSQIEGGGDLGWSNNRGFRVVRNVQ